MCTGSRSVTRNEAYSFNVPGERAVSGDGKNALARSGVAAIKRAALQSVLGSTSQRISQQLAECYFAATIGK